MLNKLGRFAGYDIYSELEVEKEEKSDKGYSLVVSGSLFIKWKKKSYTWKDYWKKSRHNKGVEKLRKMFHKEEYAVFD